MEMKILKVTKVSYYTLEMIDEKRTAINGWTPEDVVKDWFEHCPPGSSHATRDVNRIGGAEKVLKTEVITTEELLQGIPTT